MNYVKVSSCEASNNVGIQILVAVPFGRELSEKISEEVRRQGYKLYDMLQADLEATDPDEIAACEQEGRELLALFDQPIFAEKIPNEYDKSNRPWFVVTTKIGHIKIGWRKRVIVIDWSRTTNKGRAVDLFEDDVTKDAHMIHAWGYEKAKQYIERLMQ